MIPKIIHYCWFGHNPKSEIILKCIQSWKKNCPDFEIIEWNEKNFNVKMIPYVKAAYEDKKWAFVSDYARLYAVYMCGGVYLDTDVFLHNSIDELLKYKCWLASDDVRYIATGLGFGAEKGNMTIKAIMDAYNNYEYPSGTNVVRDTRVVEALYPSWIKSDKNLLLGDLFIIGLKEYGRYATHLYTYTWADELKRKQREEEILNRKREGLSVKLVWELKCFMRQPKFIKYFDRKRGSIIEKIYTFIAYDLIDCVIWYYVKRLWIKVKK